jgi:hypothetical protein
LQRSDSTRNKAIISNAVKDLFVEKRDVEALSLSLSLSLSFFENGKEEKGETYRDAYYGQKRGRSACRASLNLARPKGGSKTSALGCIAPIIPDN